MPARIDDLLEPDCEAMRERRERRERQQHFERVVIDKTHERAIQEVSGKDGRQQTGDEAGAPIERDRGQRPHREHGQHADDGRHERRDALDVRRVASRPCVATTAVAMIVSSNGATATYCPFGAA